MLIDPVPKNRNEKERHQGSKLQHECGCRVNRILWLNPQFIDQVYLREGYRKQPKDEEWIGRGENAFAFNGIVFIEIVLSHWSFLQVLVSKISKLAS
jgi:hypothetical protein